MRRPRELFMLVSGMIVGVLMTGVVLPLAVGDSDGGGANPPHERLTSMPSGPVGTPSAAASPSLAESSVPAAGLGASSSDRPAGVGNGSDPAAVSASDPDALRPTDRGVTATSIKVGFILLDLGPAATFGFTFPGVDPAQQRRAFQVYVDDINQQGGILGRKIEPVFRTFDVLSQDDQRKACLEMTEDEKVFAVVAQSGFRDAAMLCVTEEHGTPLLAMGETTPNEYIRRSAERMFIFTQVGNRMMANWVAGLDEADALKGKRIGILDDLENSHSVTDEGLIPALTRSGYTVTHRSTLSADYSIGASQIPVEVQQMQIKNVDTVLLNTHQLYDVQFVREADAQGWTPQWALSDWSGMANDGSGVDNMPASFNGTLAVTQTRTGEWRAGIPEPATEMACRQQYERATGEQIPRTSGGKQNSTNTVTMAACNLTRLFEAGARGAGPDLTRGGLSTAIQNLGDFPLARSLGGSLRPGKFDLPNVERMLRFGSDCTCWRIAGPPHRSRN